MKLFKKKSESHKEKNSLSNPEHDSSLLVEDLVAELQQKKLKKAFCYVVLFGKRPLTGKMSEDMSIMVFTNSEKADSFITGYQQYYRTTEPLSVLGLSSVFDLWVLLNNPANDELYETPYGLIIDFNYSGQPYKEYLIEHLKNIGVNGLEIGFRMIS